MEKEKSLLSKKTNNISIGKEETLMLLRIYQCHPSAWGDIIDEMKENQSKLPAMTQRLYKTSSRKQLRDRLSLKLRKLMAQKAPIEDPEIREEVRNVQAIESRHSGICRPEISEKSPPRSSSHRHPSTSRRPSTSTSCPSALTSGPPTSTSTSRRSSPRPGTSRDMKRSRDAIMTTLSSDEDDNNRRKPKTRKPHTKKHSLMELIRENQEKYNKFISKKIPKLLTALGVESSDSE